jgi:hypothetical protein
MPTVRLRFAANCTRFRLGSHGLTCGFRPCYRSRFVGHLCFLPALIARHGLAIEDRQCSDLPAP